MSRFVAPDLSKLPPPDVLEPIGFEQGLKERLADLKLRASYVGKVYDTGHLLTDPLRLDQEVSMDREVNLRTRVNDAAKAVMLATSWGANLDGIAATYYGISRLEGEKDEDFKPRIVLAVEAFSTAGPEGAYVFHALELDGRRSVSDAAAYSEEDEALYADDTPVIAPEVLVVVVPSLSHLELEDWAEDMILRDEVYTALSAKDVRPVGDKVTVMIAQRNLFNVVAELRFKSGADITLAIKAAEKNVAEYCKEQRRVGAIVERLGLGAALKVAGVKSINLIEPLTDIDPGSLGCPDLDQMTISATDVAEGWR